MLENLLMNFRIVSFCVFSDFSRQMIKKEGSSSSHSSSSSINSSAYSYPSSVHEVGEVGPNVQFPADRNVSPELNVVAEVGRSPEREVEKNIEDGDQGEVQEGADVDAQAEPNEGQADHQLGVEDREVDAQDQHNEGNAQGQADNQPGVGDQGNWLSYAEIMGDSYPAKSRVVYLKAYRHFERFLKSRNQYVDGIRPTEQMVLNYFHYLHNELKYASSTLWSTYARINAVMSRVHGVRLQSFTRVGDLLKNYGGGYVPKQAAIFTCQQIEDFLLDPTLSSKYWLVRKVICLLGYFGGFRSCELKSLKFENCQLDSVGYWFTFKRSKQRGKQEPSHVCIPRRQSDWIPVAHTSTRNCTDFDPASVLDVYFEEIQNDLGVNREELKGDLFRSTHGTTGKKFTNISIGKNTLGKVGIEIAQELGLLCPERFTGHCWRRSCGTAASDAGVNVTTLMSMMGWSNPKTAMVYVNKSRKTSLTMSLYLANVQRSNCEDPFPETPEERRRILKQLKGTHRDQPVKANSVNCPPTSTSGASERSHSTEQSVSDSDVNRISENDDFDTATQELVREIEEEEKVKKSFDSLKREVQASNQSVAVKTEQSVAIKTENVGRNSGGNVSSIDPRLANILQNLSNSGTLNIHIHFDSDKK